MVEYALALFGLAQLGAAAAALDRSRGTRLGFNLDLAGDLVRSNRRDADLDARAVDRLSEHRFQRTPVLGGALCRMHTKLACIKYVHRRHSGIHFSFSCYIYVSTFLSIAGLQKKNHPAHLSKKSPPRNNDTHQCGRACNPRLLSTPRRALRLGWTSSEVF